MTIKAARLDAQGIYQGMDELNDESQLTALHVPEVTECDLPAGKYRWDAEGETFVPLFVAALESGMQQTLDDMERLVEGAVKLALAHRAEESDLGITAGEVLAIVRRRYPQVWERNK